MIKNYVNLDVVKELGEFISMLLLNSVLGGLILFVAFGALHSATPASWPMYASAIYTVTFNLNSMTFKNMSIERTMKNMVGLGCTSFWWLLS